MTDGNNGGSRRHKIKNAAWFPYTVAACIAVILFAILSNLTGVLHGVGAFIGFFKPLILGCIIAYIVNPLANLFSRLLSKPVKKKSTRTLIANILAFVVVVLFLVFAVVILIPQLAESVQTFTDNLDSYLVSLNTLLENWGLAQTLDLSKFISSSESILGTISTFITENIGDILATTAYAGKTLVRWLIAFILSIYLLSEKQNLKAGLRRLLKAIFGEDRYGGVSVFLHKCNDICKSYIVFNLLDCLIVGIVNAIFMTICGMQYVGLISFVVAVFNLIPTFGPIIGALIGAFVLLMVKPSHALIFLIFTLVLQVLDGYILKPRLFGNTLGVSGLLILVGVVVGGNMFGIVGMLAAIPAVAVIDLIYKGYFLPWLEGRREKKRGSGSTEIESAESGRARIIDMDDGTAETEPDQDRGKTVKRRRLDDK